MGFSPFTPPLAPFKSGAATGVVAARKQRPKPSGRESPFRRCWTNGTQFTRNLQRNFPDADFWGVSEIHLPDYRLVARHNFRVARHPSSWPLAACSHL